MKDHEEDWKAFAFAACGAFLGAAVATSSYSLWRLSVRLREESLPCPPRECVSEVVEVSIDDPGSAHDTADIEEVDGAGAADAVGTAAAPAAEARDLRGARRLGDSPTSVQALALAAAMFPGTEGEPEQRSSADNGGGRVEKGKRKKRAPSCRASSKSTATTSAGQNGLEESRQGSAQEELGPREPSGEPAPSTKRPSVAAARAGAGRWRSSSELSVSTAATAGITAERRSSTASSHHQDEREFPQAAAVYIDNIAVRERLQREEEEEASGEGCSQRNA